MGNPSTVWAQLSLPASPVGSIPYVASDGQTIKTDVLHFQYLDGTLTTPVASDLPYQLFLWNGIQVKYSDTSAQPSNNPTINQIAGRCVVPAGNAFVTINNSCMFSTSIVHATLETNDSNAKNVTYVNSGLGFLQIHFNASTAGAVTVSFIIFNVTP